MTENRPQRRRVELPAVTHWPRVGKIRLGVQVPKSVGSTVTRPKAIDYFRVDPEDEITTPEAAASFREVYGDRPTVLRCQLPGATPDACFEGAYRLYGKQKLKRICDGTTCDERGATGEWETKPCVCAAARETGRKVDQCTLTWTLNVLLPDVVGMGVWQIDTSSEISANRVSAWLQMMHTTMGSLALVEFDLHLSAVTASPSVLKGKSTTVYVLDPRAIEATPRELISGAVGRASRVQIEAGPVPAVPEPVIDQPEPVAPEPPADEPPAKDSPEYKLAAKRLDELQAMGAAMDDIRDAGEKLGINWWHLADDATYQAVIDHLPEPAVEPDEIREPDEKAPQIGTTDPDEYTPPTEPEIPGQGTL